MTTLLEMEAHAVPLAAVPAWKQDAADAGRRWAMQLFPSLRPSPGIAWFAGPPAAELRGAVYPRSPGELWLWAEMASAAEIVEIAAHETSHAGGIVDEATAELVGRLAAKAWTGERAVYVRHGPVPERWVPDDVKAEDGFVPAGAIVLEIDGGLRTLVNRGTASVPSWIPATIATL